MHKYGGTICDMLGIDYPLIQGGMAWVSNASLAAAVSMAGGLGVIAAGNAPPEWVAEQIRKVREKTDKPFGVNVMLLSPYVEDVARIVTEERVPIVITGAGNPSSYVRTWKEAGCIVAPVVASRALAMMMQRMGADFLIAEGCEAGGHIGELTTMVLVPDIVRSVGIPVVAAGGIFDADTVAAAFCLGAKGVQVGTRFILAEECTAHEEYKNRIIKAKDIDSKVTGRITGHPVRVLRSPLVRVMARVEYEENAVEKLEELGVGSLQNAVLYGDKDNGSFMAGQCACMLDRVQTAAEIIRELFDEERLKSICNQVFCGRLLEG
ncbi:MAG: nitronate monooxygenase [Eubacteriales bacterium]|nr:nitronate monooxygenase [Eubacteriales bacterium]